MLGGINNVAQQIASVYNANNLRLAEILKRIASGKKVDNPNDDFTGYMRAAGLQTDVSQYEYVKADLIEASAVASVAELAGNGVYDDLARMKTLVGLYWDAAGDADEQAAYAAEFNALKVSVQNSLDNTKYNGDEIISDVFSYTVYTDPEHSGEIEITFEAADIPSIAGLTIGDGGKDKATEEGEVQDEINAAISYLVKAESFGNMITRQMNIIDTIIQSKESTISLITEIDEVEEMTNATEMNIRQQSALAMIAQANLLHNAVARLYSNISQ